MSLDRSVYEDDAGDAGEAIKELNIHDDYVNKLAQYEYLVKNLKHDNETLMKQISLLEEQGLELIREKSILQQQLHSCRKSYERKLNEQKDEMTDLNEKLVTIETEKLQVEEQLRFIQDKKRGIEWEIQKLHEKTTDVEQRLIKSQTSESILKEQLSRSSHENMSQCEEKNSLFALLQTTEAHCKSQDEKVNELSNVINTLQREISDKDTEITCYAQLIQHCGFEYGMSAYTDTDDVNENDDQIIDDDDDDGFGTECNNNLTSEYDDFTSLESQSSTQRLALPLQSTAVREIRNPEEEAKGSNGTKTYIKKKKRKSYLDELRSEFPDIAYLLLNEVEADLAQEYSPFEGTIPTNAKSLPINSSKDSSPRDSMVPARNVITPEERSEALKRLSISISNANEKKFSQLCADKFSKHFPALMAAIMLARDKFNPSNWFKRILAAPKDGIRFLCNRTNFCVIPLIILLIVIFVAYAQTNLPPMYSWEEIISGLLLPYLREEKLNNCQ